MADKVITSDKGFSQLTAMTLALHNGGSKLTTPDFKDEEV